MKGFRVGSNGIIVGSLLTTEISVLRSLVEQLATLVDGTPVELDSAVARLFPDAYRNDPVEAAEFRRLTERDLRDRKKGNAETVIRTLDSATPKGTAMRFEVDPGAANAWLRALADVRLVLAARLGLNHDDTPVDSDGDDNGARGAYEWLAWLQDSLVRACSKQLP